MKIPWVNRVILFMRLYMEVICSMKGFHMSKTMFFISAAFSFLCFASTIDVYDFTAYVKVPRVYDNSNSTGYRKYQTQKIKGQLAVRYEDEYFPTIVFLDLYNTTHKVGNSFVTYNCHVNDDFLYHRLNFIGSNKTKEFKTPSICLFLEAYPNYAKGSPSEDNSLYLMIAGSGNSMTYRNATVAKHIHGKIAGTIGCSCSTYGHMSPTRVACEYGASESVDDVCSVYGTFCMRYNKSASARNYLTAIICK